MNKILLKTTIIFTALFSLNVVASPLDWQKVKRPIPSEDGKASPIGSYTNGCIIGAQALPPKGEALPSYSYESQSLLWSSKYDSVS